MVFCCCVKDLNIERLVHAAQGKNKHAYMMMMKFIFNEMYHITFHKTRFDAFTP